MATTTSITTSYAGQFASKYISAALLSANTLDKGLIEILPNVNYRTTLQKVNTDGIVRDATCDFDATSTLTLTDRILEVEPFQVNLQLCKKDYYDSWIGGQMGFSAYDSIPASFADFLIAHVAAKTSQKIEQNIWLHQFVTLTAPNQREAAHRHPHLHLPLLRHHNHRSLTS